MNQTFTLSKGNRVILCTLLALFLAVEGYLFISHGLYLQHPSESLSTVAIFFFFFLASAGIRLGYALGMIALMALSAFIMYNYNDSHNRIIIVIPVVATFLAITAIVDQMVSKLIISNTEITYITLFSRRIVPIVTIKGYRKEFQSISLETFNKKKELVIKDYPSLGKKEELLRWLKSSFTTLP